MQAAPRIAVAASGGLDSTALLHCVHRWAAPAGIVVHALHVNHGLHADADRWQAQLAARCARWARRRGGLVFQAATLPGRPAPGDSIEAWARRERYAALARLAADAGCRIVLLAHHRRDQAETVLLQALRGAGPAGLAAMPASVQRAGVLWLRPWLDQPRERIEAYARRWRLEAVEDPANADLRYARSRLRQAALPVLRGAFPDAEVVLGAVARRAHEAAEVLAEIGALDAAMAVEGGRLVVARWLGLGAGRRANLLRTWLRSVVPAPVPDSLIVRLMDELPAARATARWPVSHGRWLALAGGRLGVADIAPPAAGTAEVRTIDLSLPGRYDLPQWAGRLEVEPSADGVPAVLLAGAQLRPRCGGERFQLRPRTVPRSLKKQFQAAGVASAERCGPLVWSADRLLFVPGLGIDARAAALAGDDRRQLRWRR